MTTLSMIVAHADNRIIGKNNDMPWHLPADLAYFKKITLGKPIIMGRKTYESIGRPLPGRQNIVISRDENYQAAGIDSVTSVEQAISLAGEVDEVMVIGGGAIYAHCLPFANRLYITHIKSNIEGDTQFPEYDVVNDWQLTQSEQLSANENNVFDLDFCIYDRS
jgi:dihydrofolate reductase